MNLEICKEWTVDAKHYGAGEKAHFLMFAMQVQAQNSPHFFFKKLGMVAYACDIPVLGRQRQELAGSHWTAQQHLFGKITNKM